MTEPTKRGPGRPKGSRNRPRGPEAPLIPTTVDRHPNPPPAPVPPPAPAAEVQIGGVPFASVRDVHVTPLRPRGLRVVLALRVAMSTPGERVEIEWPPGYPLPSSGDLVVYEGTIGHVAAIEHRPAEALIVLHLR